MSGRAPLHPSSASTCQGASGTHYWEFDNMAQTGIEDRGGFYMAARQPRLERVGLFSDGVFAVLITVLVLELKPPEVATFSALLPLWPTGLSYAVSYLFIAIVWVNHHHLFGYAEIVTPRLVWFNFLHLFSVSLIPFTTEWIAGSRLAPAPVALYAAVFVIVNATYLALCWEVVDRPAHEDVTQLMRRLLTMRSFVTIGVFVAASAIALVWPIVGMALISVCLITYLRPDIPSRGASDGGQRAPAS
jgi:uncharacterized membrane protein